MKNDESLKAILLECTDQTKLEILKFLSETASYVTEQQKKAGKFIPKCEMTDFITEVAEFCTSSISKGSGISQELCDGEKTKFEKDIQNLPLELKEIANRAVTMEFDQFEGKSALEKIGAIGKEVASFQIGFMSLLMALEFVNI